jgi:hypothetical protein
MTGVGWYSQQISLNFLNLVKFYICKPKSTGRGSLIKKQTICNSGCIYISLGSDSYVNQSVLIKIYLLTLKQNFVKGLPPEFILI